MDCHETQLPMLLCHCDHISNQFSRMDFKHKSSLPNNGNYMDVYQSTTYKPPYNESMLHHINTSSKEQYHHQQQHMSVYEMNSNNHHHQQSKYTMPSKSNYQYRSPNSLRLRRRCRSECLSPIRGVHYQYNNMRSAQAMTNSNGYHHQDNWRQQQQQHDLPNHYDYNNKQQDIPVAVNGYKYRFNNLQVDGKSVQFEHYDASDDYEYYSWHENRRGMRARSESAASQDYYYRTNYLDDFGDNSAKRSRELKERRSPTHRNVTNPKNNVSVLVNNSSNHFRYSPKTKIRSHHSSLKIGSLVRGSSPIHKPRLWKNQNSCNSLVNSADSSTFTNGSSSSNSGSSSTNNYNGVAATNMQQNNNISRNKHNDIDYDEEDDEDDDEEPPMLYGPGDQIIDDDMTDPEDNYESSLSLSSSERSLAFNCAKNLTINTECVQGGRVLQHPLASSLFPFVPPYISFATFEDKGPELPAAIHKILKWKLTTITPLLVRKVLLNTGFRLMKKPNGNWVGTWGKHMKSGCFKTLHSYQKFNHLPGSFQIGRKDRCWRNLQTLMSRHGKKEFGFMPRTFIIPQDLNLLRQSWHKYSQKNTKWIIKPPASARGTGIHVVNSWSQIPKRKPLIVQRYIERPLLINGSKFDLRLYVLVTSLNPLRVYMHTDGLARFASVKYSERTETLNDRYMHLTNYSINKLSTSYDKNDDANACKGMKWTIKSLWSFLQQKGINTERLWGALRNLVLRTILAGEGQINNMMKVNLQNKYNAFELFGIDVLLDSECVPWLLEVNISPSLHSASGLDMAVKGPLVTALLNTAMYQIPPKIPVAHQSDLSRELNVKMPLCYDKRIYVTTLSKEERQKHHQFTQKTILREDYLSAILENLTPDDVRCLILSEDELNRCHPLERIFPAPNSNKYLKFTEHHRYYNNLLDAWEYRYSKKRESGIALLRTLCWKRVHLKVPPSTIQKDCDDNELEKIPETLEETKVATSQPIMYSEVKPSMEPILVNTVSEDIEIDSNENKDTSNLAAEISPKKTDINDKCCIMSPLPITADSEIILVKQ
ncbi:hypothetical protein PVAND_004533 [Polypedilum vanderplanki]|uniref:Tubulin polyglutamylase TTLL4-like protein n=1 Tax=Polypedilum vanderplanki TaxID=319348 RepID=A0A9J6BYF4_POLVA|nr:hypothetical protein PVAND_004533 [Polypedilum vanderplanki]